MKNSITLAVSAAAALACSLFFVAGSGKISAFRPAPAAAQAKPEILIVGTYHMANPGRDIFNASADDVLSPRRQVEITELLAVLKRFRPTKIAIESTGYDDTRKKQYSD